MASTTTIEAVKTALRIKHDKLDDDIEGNVNACLKDLEVCGIVAPNEQDPLILQAVKLYCRAAYTDNKDQAARYTEAYNALKGTLMVAEGYGG